MERVEQTPGTLASGGAGAGARESAVVDEVDLIPVRTYWQLVRQRFAQHKLAVIALFILAVMVTIAVAVPLLSGNVYKASNLSKVDAGPSLAAPLGYDEIGQNIFVRLAKATQTSLIIGVAAVLIIAGIGSLVGSIAGYVGGLVDNILMRFVDIVLSLPVFFIILMIVSFFGVGDVRVVIIAIGITGWTLAARLIRAEFLRLRDADYVQAARALGAGHRRIVARHMLPAAMAPLVVASALGVADSVVVEAALSFLGFGISLPEASLGNMLNNAQEYFYASPERIFYPGLVLVLLVLCASFLGDGLRDALDPRQRIQS
jgi:ABC-type dipeptide/oligopeptide/nickel transport system permease subunit